MMPPGIPAVEGKPAIRDYVEAAMQLPGFQTSWEPLTVHVASSGDMAYMIERNVSTVADSSGNLVTTYGKVVTVWLKDADGSWKNVIDMWNEPPQPRLPNKHSSFLIECPSPRSPLRRSLGRLVKTRCAGSVPNGARPLISIRGRPV